MDSSSRSDHRLPGFPLREQRDCKWKELQLLNWCECGRQNWTGCMQLEAGYYVLFQEYIIKKISGGPHTLATLGTWWSSEKQSSCPTSIPNVSQPTQILGRKVETKQMNSAVILDWVTKEGRSTIWFKTFLFGGVEIIMHITTKWKTKVVNSGAVFLGPWHFTIKAFIVYRILFTLMSQFLVIRDNYLWILQNFLNYPFSVGTYIWKMPEACSKTKQIKRHSWLGHSV